MLDKFKKFGKKTIKYYLIYLGVSTIAVFITFKFFVFPSFDNEMTDTLKSDHPLVKIAYSGYEIKDPELKFAVLGYKDIFLRNVDATEERLYNKYKLIEELKKVDVEEPMYATDCGDLVQFIEDSKFLNTKESLSKAEDVFSKYYEMNPTHDCKFKLQDAGLIKL